MSAAWRMRLGLLALLPLLSLRAAEAPPPAEETATTQPAPPAPAEAAERPAPPPPQEEEEPPLEPISADNNLTFPVDI